MTGVARRPRLVWGYRYGILGGVCSALLGRLPAFARVFDVAVLLERDLGAAAEFPAGTVRVAPTPQEQVEAIRYLAPDLFVAIDSPGLIEAWDRAGSPGRLIVEVHTTTSGQSYVHGMSPAQRVDLVLASSDYLAGLLRESGVDRLAPIRVLPPALEPEWFGPTTAWTPPEPLLLWVGKLDDHKRWWAFLDLCASVRAPAVPVLAGGSTAPPDRVRDLLARLDGRRALWLPSVRRDLMPRLYAAVAASGGLSLSTSRNESSPMSVAESILMGCPVVAPAVGGIPGLLAPLGLYPPDDFGAARDLVERALADPALREEIVAKSRPLVEDRVDPEAGLARFLAALDDAL